MLVSNRFRYEIPTKIEFGIGVIESLPKFLNELGGTNVLIVGDPGVLQAGIVDQVIDPIKNSNIPFTVFTDVGTEASIESVDLGIKMAKENSCDLVIGVGGGSALDTAKAIGLMITHPGNIRDYIGMDKVNSSGAPVIAVPTTAGTGSEITRFAVLSDKEAKAKLSIGSMYICPTLAVCDPNLTLSLPPHITAATGMDALTHALESYVNKATQPISEALSIQSMKLISSSLVIAVKQGENIDARADMLMASTIAAMAFNSTRLGLAHALAIPLGAHFKIPHGVVNAMLLPSVMKFNLVGNIDKFIEVAKIFGENLDGLSKRDAAERSVKVIKRLNEDIGIHYRLSDFGVEEKHLEMIAQEAMESGNVPINPVKPTIEDLKNLCREVL
ncbi:iron-containing alcohol dehydrogenase [Chryseomicrobium palamuruense]|uniref:Iron-containing alcohol dehydrogenase n=1 Tax=Chryseomicrobium palamuruense TaxID=682973 RepID=A0ABV8UYN9_9BACL